MTTTDQTKTPAKGTLHAHGLKTTDAQIAALAARLSKLENPRLWGVIGNDGTHLAEERAAGVNAKLFELSWASYEPSDGTFSATYVTSKKAELAALRAAGFEIILSFGYHENPAWVVALPDAAYVNQYGDTYDDASFGAGRANVIWNDVVRAKTGRYITRAIADFGTDFWGIRIGGGHYGELGYPTASWAGRSNTYWAFDANAAKSNPVPGWKPGNASPGGEAGKFAAWYFGRLSDYAVWQAQMVRAFYPGRIIALLPSWGIRPGQLAGAIAGNLAGTTSAEINGEVQRGYDHAGQVAALAPLGVTISTTWLEANYGDDAGTDQAGWSPGRWLSSLAQGHGLTSFGENGGQDARADMVLAADRVIRYGLLGMLWYRESELLGGQYATLADYASVIATVDG